MTVAIMIAEHIQHVRDTTGPEHVCAGSDYVHYYAGTLDWVLRNPEMFPPEMGYAMLSHIGVPDEIWGVVRYLQENNGWIDEGIVGLIGGNPLWVYEASWE